MYRQISCYWAPSLLNMSMNRFVILDNIEHHGLEGILRVAVWLTMMSCPAKSQRTIKHYVLSTTTQCSDNVPHHLPTGNLRTVDANWKTKISRQFFGNSYSTNTIHKIQQFGLGITNFPPHQKCNKTLQTHS